MNSSDVLLLAILFQSHFESRKVLVFASKHYNSLPILLIDLQLKQKKFKDFSFLTHFTISLSNIAEIKVQSLHVIYDKLGHLFRKLKIDYTYFLIPLVMSKGMVSRIVALPDLHWVYHSIFGARKMLQKLFSTKLTCSCSHLSDRIFFCKSKLSQMLRYGYDLRV